MSRKVLIVQFTHPGGEYTVSHKELSNGVKEWNYGPHRRKFLKAVGQYVMDNGSLSPKQDLLFWGEWEPTSKILPVSNVVGTGVVPEYVHEPYLYMGNAGLILPPIINAKNGKGRQNTDPFVFGDSFLYSVCKQRKKIRNSSLTNFTKLGELEKGSIILFGSTISEKQGGPYFVLDTVFVVGDYKAYHSKKATSDLSGFVPNDYCDLMGFVHWSPSNDFICYKGATVENPINDMFSYVPCKPCSSGDIGFPRVVLTKADMTIISDDLISDNLNAAPKLSNTTNINPTSCWKQICNIVKQQGFELGVNFEYQYL
jgi:hypothetical protein